MSEDISFLFPDLRGSGWGSGTKWTWWKVCHVILGWTSNCTYPRSTQSRLSEQHRRTIFGSFWHPWCNALRCIPNDNLADKTRTCKKSSRPAKWCGGYFWAMTQCIAWNVRWLWPLKLLFMLKIQWKKLVKA